MIDGPLRVELRYRLRVIELAEAFRLASRAAHPVRARVFTVVGVLFALVLLSLCALSAPLAHEGSGGVGRELLGISPGIVVYGLLLSAQVRGLVLAWIVTLSQRREAGDHVLESFSRSAIRGRSSTWSGETSPASYPIRIETKRSFIFANAEGVLGPVIPKRIFPDEAMRSRFREDTITAPTGVEVAAALEALGQPAAEGTFVYTPDADEQLRGLWLLLRHTASLPLRLFMLVVATLFVGFLVTQTRNDGPFGTGVTLLVVVVIGLYLRYSMRRRMAAAIRPVTLRIDENGVAVTAPSGSTEVLWSQSPGYLEKDPRLLIVMIRPAFGLLLPTRVVPAAVIAEAKRRLGPYRHP